MRIYLLLATLFLSSYALKTMANNIEGELIGLAQEYSGKTSGLSEANVTRLFNSFEYLVRADKVILTRTSIWYYPSQTSVQEDGYDSIYFNGYNQVITSLQAFSMDKTGEISEFNPDDARIIDSDSYNAFSEGKEKIINYTGLQRGSMSVLRYSIETDLSKLEVPWSALVYAQSYSEQKDFILRVEILDDTPIYIDSSADLITCIKQDNLILCDGSDIPKLDSSDSHYYRDVAAHVAISSIENWDALITTMLDAYSVAQSTNASVVEQMPKLVNEEMTEEEKISAIHEFVTRDIRYLSESEAGHAYIPHSVSRTVDKRYGDCKDKTVLLIEMFEQIGVDAYPVLVNTRATSADALLLPSAQYFNHVYMCFMFNNKRHCIDSTDTTSDWRYTSQWIQGKASLPLMMGAKGERGILEKHAYGIENEIYILIGEDGGQKEQQRIAFHGAYASSYRSKLEGLEPKEKETYLIDLYQDYVSETGSPKVDVEGVDELSSPIIIQSENIFPPYLDMKNDISVIDYQPWVNSEVNSYEAKNKTYATQFAGTKVRSQVTVELPANWQIKSYPAELNLMHSFASLTRKITRKENNTFSMLTEFSLPAATIELEKSDEFNKLLKVLLEQTDIELTATK
ncbi:transglutaminase domain-containing protein [Ningiella sp. W23]|uniref:transglutaminase-like domain-containing protein n=1 Tax=Ningiella sp. W23 TaxID=3023715 RepID=UPI0037567B5F